MKQTVKNKTTTKPFSDFSNSEKHLNKNSDRSTVRKLKLSYKRSIHHNVAVFLLSAENLSLKK